MRPSTPPQPASGSAASGRILIVDDSREMIALLTAWLGSGHEVHAASGAEEALAIAAAVPLDVAILDIVLPGLSGFDIAERFREDPRLAAIQVILITGLENPANAARAASLGALDVLYKPLDYERVHGCVRRALELRRAPQHAAPDAEQRRDRSSC